MTLTVLFFAGVRELVGLSERDVVVPAEVATMGDFATHLVTVFPALAGRLASVRWAKNEHFVDMSEPLQTGDVIALIPPVAGG